VMQFCWKTSTDALAFQTKTNVRANTIHTQVDLQDFAIETISPMTTLLMLLAAHLGSFAQPACTTSAVRYNVHNYVYAGDCIRSHPVQITKQLWLNPHLSYTYISTPSSPGSSYTSHADLILIPPHHSFTYNDHDGEWLDDRAEWCVDPG